MTTSYSKAEGHADTFQFPLHSDGWKRKDKQTTAGVFIIFIAPSPQKKKNTGSPTN